MFTITLLHATTKAPEASSLFDPTLLIAIVIASVAGVWALGALGKALQAMLETIKVLARTVGTALLVASIAMVVVAALIRSAV